ncbi:MAG: hypothetical protein ACTSRK_09360 [Promethearchaeota archaeon]
MSNENKFCPNCGTDLEGGKTCSKCGFELDKGQNSVDYKNTNVNVWETIEKYVVLAGKYAWIFLLINMIAYIIAGISTIVVTVATSKATGISASFGLLWTGIWMILGAIISGALLYFFVLPFSKKIVAKDYAYLVNDVILFGKIRVPKMLLIGIILEIFSQGWGGLFVLIPAICICFLGPVYMNWRA